VVAGVYDWLLVGFAAVTKKANGLER